METELITQYNNQISKSHGVAIVLPELANIDVYASAVALASYLETKNKQVSIISSSRSLPDLKFLNHTPTVYQSLNSSDELLVNISSENAEPDQVRYEKTPKGLQFYIKPKDSNTKFLPEDVSVAPTSNNFDLLIILEASNFEELGLVYKNNPQFFFNTTKVAVSNKPDHEYFAAVNIVDTEAAALSELIYELIVVEPEAIKLDQISTSLLTGIIYQTQSFRNPKTTPETLAKAARLVDAGARQQDIIQQLYKTKPFNLLQLWGRGMARIKSYPEQSLLFSVLTTQDFQKTKTNPEMLAAVAEELIQMAEGYSLVALAAELQKGVRLLLAGLPHTKLRKLAANFSSLELPAPEPLIANYKYTEITLPNLELSQVESLLKQHIPKV